ncbi:MAG: hypothetical protein AAF471_00190, partial [Myxococcota bacterium]
DRHELELYRKADMARRDRASQLETSYDKGHKKGRVEGREEGLAEGEKKGHEEGLAEGEKKGREEGLLQGKRDVARNLLKSGMEPAAIAAATGLTHGEIESL